MLVQARQSWEFMAAVNVVCPRCRGSAIVQLLDTEMDWRSMMFGARRLTCTGCGLSRHQPACTRSNPSMGCELYLKAVTRWGELAFFNREHLAYVAGYIASPNRYVHYGGAGPRNNAILSRLPRWAKLARHRTDVLAAIARL